MPTAKLKLEFHPLTSDRWTDFETLFGARGGCGGCWCMWWRVPRAQFNKQKGETNKRAMRAIVEAGQRPGILAYANGTPIGWCAVAPRDSYPVLDRSRVLQRVDDQHVWSIVCLFVNKEHRRQGVSVRLLKAAVDFVRERGGHIIEGYPTEPKRDQPDTFVWTGLAAAFRKAGFKECLRRSETRPIMRREIKGKRKNGIAELIELFRKLGADDPEGWARSQVKEGKNQLGRFLFLRQAWRKVIAENDHSWIQTSIDYSAQRWGEPCSGIGPALQRMLDKGVDPRDITDVGRVKQYELLFALCHLIWDPGELEPEVKHIYWKLVQFSHNNDDVDTIEALHEDALVMDPTGREMRPR